MRFSFWLKKISLALPVQCFSIAIFASQPQTYLEISPNICVVKRLGDLCSMEVNVKWQTPTTNDFCLYQDDSALKCWLNAQKINTHLLITMNQDMIITLRSNEKVFAQKTVNVNAVVPQKYRRKLRADWSVF